MRIKGGNSFGIEKMKLNFEMVNLVYYGGVNEIKF